MKMPKVVTLQFGDYWLETDRVNDLPRSNEDILAINTSPRFNALAILDGAIDVSYDLNRVYVAVDRESIYRAVNKVRCMGLDVDRVTVLNGVTQAHPPSRDHWECPFCYPQEVPL